MVFNMVVGGDVVCMIRGGDVHAMVDGDTYRYDCWETLAAP